MPSSPKRPSSSKDNRRKTRRKMQSNKRKTRRQHSTSPCNIPIRAPALNYLSSLRNKDFYSWVNDAWLKKAKILPHQAIVDAGDDTEKCLYSKFIQIIQQIRKKKNHNPMEKLLSTFANSCLHARAQKNSVTTLKNYLHTLHCISTPEDVFKTAVQLNLNGFKSLFDLQLTLDDRGHCQLYLNMGSAGLFYKRYSSREMMKQYKELLTKLGEHFEIPNLHEIIPFEKHLVNKMEDYYKENSFSCKGSMLLRKFPGIPWQLYFESFGINDWKTRIIYYSSPRYIRLLGRLLREVRVETWKLFFANCYILSYLHVLPPPYDEMEYEFFGRSMTGLKKKTPQMQLLYMLINYYLSNEYSQLFWKEEGNEKVKQEVEHLSEKIIQAAIDRVDEATWLERGTRNKSIVKLDNMKQSIARPRVWLPILDVELDEKNLLYNCIVLAQANGKRLVERLDKPFHFWEDAVTRVNASYYKRNNQILIPYGQMQPPFYSPFATDAWNYGALGCIIGHEICHGFDEEGKDFDEKGRKKPWWTAKNNRAYKKKTKALIDLYSAVTLQGHRVNGKRMLSENLADLAGVAIALHALKKTLGDVSEEEKKEAFRTFFLAFATSWRTKYREERLTRLLERDVHAPAQLRVNLVVSQFQEWIDAFGIDEESPMYVKPEERIVIF